MAIEILDTYLTSSLASGGTITFSYPSGRTAASYLPVDEVLMIPAAGRTIDDPVVTYGSSTITVPYTGATLAANTRIRLQVTVQDAAEDYFPDAAATEADIRSFGGSPLLAAAGNDAAITAAETAINAASSGGVLKFPPGDWNFTYRLPSTSIIWDFAGPLINRGDLGGGATVNWRTARHAYHAGPHATTRTTTEAISTVAYGSNQNGVAFADVGHEVNVFKENWSNPALAQVGEIDGQVIVVRQGGPTSGTKSSAGGQVIDVQMTDGAGFLCSFEHVSTVVDPTAGLSILYQIGSQNLVLNSRDGDYYGHVWNVNVGTLDACILVQAQSGASWGDILRNVKTTYFNFKIDVDGKLTWNGANSTGTTSTLGGEVDGSVHVRDGSGNDLLAVAQTGALTLRSTQASPTTRTLAYISGAPEGNVTGNIGDLVLRTDAPTHTCLYRKTTTGGNTGWVALTERLSGATGSRPGSLNATHSGLVYFDTTLGKPIWWNNPNWVDATGTTV